MEKNQMSIKLNPKDELKPRGLKGISDQQIEYHFGTHYKGYVNKLNESGRNLKQLIEVRQTRTIV
jgi:superoxide dismutase